MADGLGAKPLRCAVYTRKSTDEGLEQAFNSLHAQREACEAYILSQKHEGWTLIPTAYDDGGFSGGSMERPALKILMDDVRAGLIDVIVVYKVDRLTRSLADFAKMVELFDSKGVSFVSVTQAFNTTTSMGRLTLNVLLSFAQFEREVTGERIRDKIAASKAKGMWMGGLVPLGYDPKDRTLVVNEPEAEQVRTLFKEYLKLKSVDLLAQRADQLGIRSKRRGSKGGGKLGRSSLYRMLASPIYAGDIPHGKKRYPGQHEAIVGKSTFDAVQELLALNRRRSATAAAAAEPAALASLVWDDQGRRLVSTHTSKRSRRYRYYAVTSKESGDDPLRIPAAPLEQLVVDHVSEALTSTHEMARMLHGYSGSLAECLMAAKQLGTEISQAQGSMLRGLLAEIVAKVVVAKDIIAVHLQAARIAQGTDHELVLSIPAKLGRRKASLSLVLPNKPAPAVDATLVSMVARGRVWFEAIASGKYRSIEALARQEGVTGSYIRRLADFAFLAPDLVEMILSGNQPTKLTPELLLSARPLPHCWEDQRVLLLNV